MGAPSAAATAIVYGASGVCASVIARSQHGLPYEAVCLPDLLAAAEALEMLRRFHVHATENATRRAPRPSLDGFERLRKLRRIGAARLRHVGAPAAFAADLLRDVVHELARFDPAR